MGNERCIFALRSFTAVAAIAAGVTAGVAASGLYGIFLGLRRGNDWGGVRGADIKTTIEFGIPAWVLSGAAGALSARTLGLAPPLLYRPMQLALAATLVGGAGGSFGIMMAMSQAESEAAESSGR